MTVLGLCFGGGQLALGAAGLTLGVAVLWRLKSIESRMRRTRQATLIVATMDVDLGENDLRSMLERPGFRVISTEVIHRAAHQVRFRWELEWRDREQKLHTANVIESLASDARIDKLEWRESRLS